MKRSPLECVRLKLAFVAVATLAFSNPIEAQQSGRTQPGPQRQTPAGQSPNASQRNPAAPGRQAPAKNETAPPKTNPAVQGGKAAQGGNGSQNGLAAPNGIAGQASSSAAPANAQSTSEVAAMVNGQPISRNTLAQECVVRYGAQVIESMLNKYLILQACQAQSIEITQKDVDIEIGRLATKFNLNTQMFLELIEKERDIKPEQYASDIVWPMLALRALARDKIQINQDEVDRAYENEFGPTVKVRMIAVQDQKKALDLHTKVVADPSSFKSLAKQYSEDPSTASVEGLLPPIRKYSGDDILEQQAFALSQPDQISPLFEVGGTYIMLQFVRLEAGEKPMPDQLAAIQLRIRESLEDEKLQEMSEKLFSTLRSQSNVVMIFGNESEQAKNPGVAAYINRQPLATSMLEEECLKRFGAIVLEGEINRKLLEQALFANKQSVTQADIDSEIQRAADYYGFINRDGTPNVDEWLKSVLNEDGATLDLYVKDAIWPTVALKKLVQGSVTVTEEDLQKGFESNYGPRAEILAIVLSNQRTAQEVWQMARDNPTEAFFGELAAQYSIEPTSRSNYGKVPPVRKGSGQPTMEKVAFSLKPGELSGITEVGNQFVIMKSQGYTEPVTKDFQAVKEELYKDIHEKKTRSAMQKHLEKLLEEAMIENQIDPSKSQVGSKVRQAAARAVPKK